MRRLFVVLFVSMMLSGCTLFGPQLYEGKSAEEWYNEYKRMETKHEAVKSDYGGLKECLVEIEPRIFKSSGTTVEEITACVEKYSI